jgi:acetyltransferase-like isoleucine patch superfamily enzyme
MLRIFKLALIYKFQVIFLSFYYYFLSKLRYCHWDVFFGVKVDFQTKLEKNTRIYKRTDVRGSTVGYGSYIGWDSVIRNAVVGKYCSIGPNVNIIYGRHPVRQFISTHPAFFSVRKQAGFTYVDDNLYEENQTLNGKSVIIGNDVWLGYGVCILEGVEIGNGAIVGANSTVTTNVEPYSIYVGTPAKKVGYRYNDNLINRLNKLEWWNISPSIIKKNSNLFSDVESFIAFFDN